MFHKLLQQMPLSHRHVEPFPSDMSPWGIVSPATCRWGMFAGEASTGIVSPATIPGDNAGPTHFSVKELVPRWQSIPSDMSLGKDRD